MQAPSVTSDRQNSTAKSAVSTDGGTRPQLGKLAEHVKKHPAFSLREKDSRSTMHEGQVLTTSERHGLLAPITQADRSNKHLYITGLRGILAIESFLWTFFQTFIPTLVSNATKGPEYQDLLREILSVPLWNLSLIQNFFIILSMRTIAVSFLQSPSGSTCAGAVIRRIVRMALAVSLASGMATLIFSQIRTEYVEEFKRELPNDSIRVPGLAYDGLAAVNSLFLIFWVTGDFASQAANSFWPTGTMWVPSLIYFQSFTVYFLMVILPFTRPKWHCPGLLLFSFGSFWYGSWGWYSATGLFFADLALNGTLRSELQRGIKTGRDRRLPYWVPAVVMGFFGLALKYALTVRPKYVNKLLVLHPFVDLAENTSLSQIAKEPYARLDDWFLITAILVMVELFEPVQFLLSFKPLVWLGERSLSIYFLQCITVWTAGIKLWLFLHVEKHMSDAGANAVVFIVCLFAIALFSEIFYRAVDLPSQWAARHAYMFLTS